MRIDLNKFKFSIKNKYIKPGSAICIINGERGFLNFIISTVQEWALYDLYPNITDSVCKNYSKYTHIGCVLDEYNMAEMVYPHAHYVAWSNMIGKTILIKTPKTIESKLNCIVSGFVSDIERKYKYSIRELFYYYFRWAIKAKFSHEFAKLFKSKKYDVCSGRWIHWANESDISYFHNEIPESWYPARIAIEDKKFETYGPFTLA